MKCITDKSSENDMAFVGRMDIDLVLAFLVYHLRTPYLSGYKQQFPDGVRIHLFEKNR